MSPSLKQKKVGKENGQRLIGKRIDSENWVQGHVSRFELLVLCRMVLGSHENRLAVSKTKTLLEVRFGDPQLFRTWRGPNHPQPAKTLETML